MLSCLSLQALYFACHAVSYALVQPQRAAGVVELSVCCRAIRDALALRWARRLQIQFDRIDLGIPTVWDAFTPASAPPATRFAAASKI